MVEDMKKVGLDDLKAAALAEQWEEVDANLVAVAESPEFIGWAKGEGVAAEDDNVRDLAVSILERSSCELTPQDSERLLDLLGNDPNPFVQYRSAFALFNRGDRSEEVVNKIREAAGDEDVREIAEEYLSQLT